MLIGLCMLLVLILTVALVALTILIPADSNYKKGPPHLYQSVGALLMLIFRTTVLKTKILLWSDTTAPAALRLMGTVEYWVRPGSAAFLNKGRHMLERRYLSRPRCRVGGPVCQ